VIAMESINELFLKIYSASVCNLPCDIKSLPQDSGALFTAYLKPMQLLL